MNAVIACTRRIPSDMPCCSAQEFVDVPCGLPSADCNQTDGLVLLLPDARALPVDAVAAGITEPTAAALGFTRRPLGADAVLIAQLIDLVSARHRAVRCNIHAVSVAGGVQGDGVTQRSAVGGTTAAGPRAPGHGASVDVHRHERASDPVHTGARGQPVCAHVGEADTARARYGAQNGRVGERHLSGRPCRARMMVFQRRCCLADPRARHPATGKPLTVCVCVHNVTLVLQSAGHHLEFRVAPCTEPSDDIPAPDDDLQEDFLTWLSHWTQSVCTCLQFRVTN
jgi:hypothetical protein